MATIRTHGGYCCGIRHISGFGFRTTKEEIESLVRSTTQRAKDGILIEAVLTNSQCRYHPDIPKWLQEIGFTCVSRFRNPNSGNICNVFHYNKSPRSLTSRLPFKLIKKAV